MQTQADYTVEQFEAEFAELVSRPPYLAHDITTCDGKVHTGFLARSRADAIQSLLRDDPGYREDDVVSVLIRVPEAAGIALTSSGNGLIGKDIRRAA